MDRRLHLEVKLKAAALAIALALFAGSVSLSPLTEDLRQQQIAHAEAQCLASAIYYEAGGEPLAGQRAVYEVIMNRVRASNKGVCEVVKAPYQFSWVGFKPFKPLTQPMVDLLARVQNHPKVLSGLSFKWFYSGAAPKWAYNMHCRVIGNHNFCREGQNNNGSRR